MNDEGIVIDDGSTGSNSDVIDVPEDNLNELSPEDLIDEIDDELSAEELLADGQQTTTAESATAVDAAAIYEPICYKLDLIILLLIVIFAAYMLKGLANPYKMGGKHIGKSG